ncbi:MAG: hypothetical protein C0504_15625 [Candidatus Solibacter sp.]|nr:hypothetical protein [Candidatus Solibacter sp.]
MREYTDEDRGRPFDLPMGGLLSELLASEGIDGGGFEDEREARPVHAAAPPAADPEPPPARSCPAAPAIALPGLLNDLLNLAGAAGSVETRPETAALPAGLPSPACPAPREAAQAFQAEPAEEPAAAEPPLLAIPGLLSLLSSGPDCAPPGPEFAPAESPPTFDGLEIEDAAERSAAAWDQRPPAGKAAAARPVPAPAECPPPFDELEIKDAAERSAEAPSAVEPEPPQLEPAEAANPVASARSAAEQQPLEREQVRGAGIEAEDSTAAGRQGVDERPSAPEFAMPAAGVPEPLIEGEPEFSPSQAAAVLAEAAGRLVQQAGARQAEPPAAALADLAAATGAVSPAGLDQQPSAAPENGERYVVFQLGGQSYGLHITCVREVERAGRVTPVPGAPPMIRGLINLHGEILPLIDPRPLLALPPREGASGGYLVVVHGAGQEGAVAWLVDGLGGMAVVDPDRISSPGQGGPADPGGKGIVSGTAGHRGRSLQLLDGRRLVSEDAIERASGGWEVRLEESQI